MDLNPVGLMYRNKIFHSKTNCLKTYYCPPFQPVQHWSATESRSSILLRSSKKQFQLVFLLVVTKPGNYFLKLLLKTPEEEKRRNTGRGCWLQQQQQFNWMVLLHSKKITRPRLCHTSRVTPHTVRKLSCVATRLNWQ